MGLGKIPSSTPGVNIKFARSSLEICPPRLISLDVKASMPMKVAVAYIQSKLEASLGAIPVVAEAISHLKLCLSNNICKCDNKFFIFPKDIGSLRSKSGFRVRS